MAKLILPTLALMFLFREATAQISSGTVAQQRTSGFKSFDITGADKYGKPVYFSSMIRNALVPLPALSYIIKRTGYYLVILTATGSGEQEKNNIYNKTDDRDDIDGVLRLGLNKDKGLAYIDKKFFYGHYDASGDATQDVTTPKHSDDGEKSLIKYFTAGDVVHVDAFVQQAVGSSAPAQKKPWYVYAQVKYIFLSE